MGSRFHFLGMESIHAKSVSGDEVVFVSNPNRFMELLKEIRSEVGIEIEDQVWSVEDRLRQTLRMLETSDEESEAETPQKAQRSSSSSSVLPVFQVGGAKAGKRKVADIEDGDEKRQRVKTPCGHSKRRQMLLDVQDTQWLIFF